MIFQQYRQVKKAGYGAYDSQMDNKRMDGIFPRALKFLAQIPHPKFSGASRHTLTDSFLRGREITAGETSTEGVYRGPCLWSQLAVTPLPNQEGGSSKKSV